MSTVAAGIVSDLTFRRQVERLCRHPRLIAEIFAEIAAEQDIAHEVEAKLSRYNDLSDEALAVTGGDRFPSAPLHKVSA
jgi:hypothetical protein